MGRGDEGAGRWAGVGNEREGVGGACVWGGGAGKGEVSSLGQRATSSPRHSIQMHRANRSAFLTLTDYFQRPPVDTLTSGISPLRFWAHLGAIRGGVVCRASGTGLSPHMAQVKTTRASVLEPFPGEGFASLPRLALRFGSPNSGLNQQERP